MPTAYIFLRLRSSTDNMPSLTVLRRYERTTREIGRKSWLRLDHLFPTYPYRLVQVDVGVDTPWILHPECQMFWSREAAEEALRCSVGAWASWAGDIEKDARLKWVNEVVGRCTVLAKTLGEGAETRRWWVIVELDVPSAEGRLPLGP